jgi:hypothetical protein
MSKWNRRDSPDGCEFTIELQLNGEQSSVGWRLFDLLTADEREEHRRIQNLVIAKLPLDEAELETLSPEWQADRLARVVPRLAPYPPQARDIWFRYLDDDDVARWMTFVGRVLPNAIHRLQEE